MPPVDPVAANVAPVPAPAGGNARLHIFIAGVSAYPYLPDVADPMTDDAYGLRKLSSPAISAFQLYRWLNPADPVKKREIEACLPLPVGSILLLLSPSPAELEAHPELAEAQARNEFQACNRTNFLRAAKQWRDNASADPRGMTWFYFAGHGIQRSKNDAVFLLEEFGDGLGGALANAVDLNTLFNGMAPSPSRPNIARTQVYFIDACRMLPEDFKRLEAQTPTQVFPVELAGVDDRQAPVFFATISGAQAVGMKARPSLFCEHLLQCLNGSAGAPIDDTNGNPVWQVTTSCAMKVLDLLIDDLRAGGLDQAFAVSGLTQGDVVLRKLKDRPRVDVSIQIDPDEAASFARLSFTDMETQTRTDVPLPLNSPYLDNWPAGIYLIDVDMAPHPTFIKPPQCARHVLPPRWQLTRKVTP